MKNTNEKTKVDNMQTADLDNQKTTVQNDSETTTVTPSSSNSNSAVISISPEIDSAVSTASTSIENYQATIKNIDDKMDDLFSGSCWKGPSINSFITTYDTLSSNVRNKFYTKLSTLIDFIKKTPANIRNADISSDTATYNAAMNDINQDLNTMKQYLGDGVYGSGEFGGAFYSIFGSLPTVINSEYGQRYVFGKYDLHHAIDLDVPGTTPNDTIWVYSPTSGEIVDVTVSNSGYGNSITIKFENPESISEDDKYLYVKLSHFSFLYPSGTKAGRNNTGYFTNLKVGDRVNPGDKLAVLGTTGSSTGEHVDVVVADSPVIGNKTTYYDPFLYFFPDTERENYGFKSNQSATGGYLTFNQAQKFKGAEFDPNTNTITKNGLTYDLLKDNFK